MLSNLLKNEIIELFNIKFNDKCFKSKKIWISKVEEIKVYVYQKGLEDGILSHTTSKKVAKIEEIINIFKQQFERNPLTTELSYIKNFINMINTTYEEGFLYGIKISEFVNEVDI